MTLLFQIYDRVAGQVIGPISAERSEGPAIRWFHQVLAEPKTSPGQAPADYDLLCLGQQSIEGRLDGLEMPQVVATGAAWLASVNAK